MQQEGGCGRLGISSDAGSNKNFVRNTSEVFDPNGIFERPTVS
jgi:hypothetical protein